MDSEKIVGAQLDSLFSTIFPAPDEPGAIVYVVRDGMVVYDRGFGLAKMNRPDSEAMTDSTLINICSISKQFAAMAMLKLAEQGQLSLQDPVSKFFPEFKALFFNDITIHHLLTHTSGIPDARPRTPEQWAEYVKLHPDHPFEDLADYKLHAQSVESIKYMEDLTELAFEPGTQYEYQNPTYQLTEIIIERLTGEDFATWMKREILEPAGMHNSRYFEPFDLFPNRAFAYTTNDNNEWVEYDFDEANFFPSKADGALYTSAREFYLWEKALFEGKIVSPESLALALTPVIETDIPGSSYGLGLFIERLPGKPQKIYHTGDNGGFFTYEAEFPDRNLFYLIFANRADWSREDTAAKVDAILTKAGWL